MRTLSRATATSSCTQSRAWWISAPSSTTSNSRVFLSSAIHPQHSISFRSASKCTRCIPFSPLSNSPTRPSFSSSSSKATTTCTASLSSASRPPTRSRPSARCSTTLARFTAATRASSTPITTPRSTRSSPSKKYRLLFPSFLVLQQRGEVRHQQLSRLPFFPLLRLAHLSPAQHRRVRRLSQHAGQSLLLQRLPLPLRPLRLPPHLPLGRQHCRPSAVHHQTRHHRLCPSFSPHTQDCSETDLAFISGVQAPVPSSSIAYPFQQLQKCREIHAKPVSERLALLEAFLEFKLPSQSPFLFAVFTSASSSSSTIESSRCACLRAPLRAAGVCFSRCWPRPSPATPMSTRFTSRGIVSCPFPSGRTSS